MTADSDNSPIGIVGVGLMGGAMALRLRALGRPVVVRDLLPEREAAIGGAAVAPHPHALALACRQLIVAVVDAAQCEAVLFGPHGVAQAARPGLQVMLAPTMGPEDTASLAQRLDAAGLGWLDAPMSGGPARARAGEMSLMVACTDTVWAAWQPLLAQLAARLFRVGTRAGDGARTKLVNNLLAAANLAAAAEGMQLARAVGLDAATTLAVLAQSSGHSWIGQDRLARWLAGDSTPQARMALLAKDSGLAMAMARQAGLSPRLGGDATALFAAACAAGLVDADDSALVSWLLAQAPARGPGPAAQSAA